MSKKYTVRLNSGEIIGHYDYLSHARAAMAWTLNRTDVRGDGVRAELLEDGEPIDSAAVGNYGAAVNIGKAVTCNDVLKSWLAGRYKRDELVGALEAAKLPISRGRLDGWFRSSTDSRFVAMSVSELLMCVEALLAESERE